MSWDRLSTVLSLFLIAALLGWFWMRGERFIAANGPTFDEGVHLTAGVSYWKTGNFHMNAEDPPLLKLLWAIPSLRDESPWPFKTINTGMNHWEIAESWLYGRDGSPRPLFDSARRVNLFIGCCLVVLVAWWGYRIWGSKLAALAASAFAAMDPTLLALSCILSTDVGLAFFGLLTCYLMWEYVAAPSRGLLFATGVSLGLTLAAKFSAVGLVVGIGVSGLVYLWRGGRLALPGKEERGFRPVLELAFRLSVIAVVTVAVTYAFINFDQWAKGLKFQLTRGEHGKGVMYLNGELSNRGWYYYFLETLLLKLPPGLLLVLFLNAALRLRSAIKTARNAWLVIPPLVFFVLASYSRVNLGVRVVLPVLPFLYLLAGGLACTECCRYLRFAFLAACLAWCGIYAELANPHELTYFNELGRLCSKSEPALLDSNLDWGQGLPALKKWMDKHDVTFVSLAFFGTDRPESHGIRYQQLPGYGQLRTSSQETTPTTSRQIVAVSTNLLYGLYLNDPNLYAWLRQRKPVTVLDGSIHVFDLSDDPEARSRIIAISSPHTPPSPPTPLPEGEGL